jgi:hypothetical protein
MVHIDIETASLSAIFEQVQTILNEVQETVRRAMGYLIYGKDSMNYSIAVETTDRAFRHTRALLRQIRALRVALARRQADRTLVRA